MPNPYFTLNYLEKSFTGSSIITGQLSHPNGDTLPKEVVQEFADELQTLKRKFPNAAVDFKLQYNQHDAANQFQAEHYYCHSLFLRGNVRTAHAIAQSWNLPERILQADLRIEEFSRKADIPDIVSLHTETFQEKYGWFLNTPEYALVLEQDLNSTLQNIHAYFILRCNGKLVGFFGGEPKSNKPREIETYGAVLVLHKSFQKKGLARLLYKHFLEKLNNLGAEYFEGGTSQPGVIRISKELKREPIFWIFGEKKFFPFEYFQYDPCK
jgi:GNAT superfamily N-acetyltransferase